MPADYEFFEGFKLPLLTNFVVQLGFCRFEKGDVIYANEKGYEEGNPTGVKFIIQVEEPAHGIGMASDEAGVFEENWKSPIVFKVLEPETEAGLYPCKEVKTITTTQGRFYTFLWKGDWAIFADEEALPCPLTCFTLMKSSSAVAFEVKNRLAGKMEKPNLFIMPYDLTHSVSTTKFEKVKKKLNSEFTVVEHIFKPSELGMEHVSIVPTVSYACFAIDLGASSKVSDALKLALYKPARNKKTDRESFKLSAHGHFVPYNDPAHGDVVTISFKHGDGLFYRYRLHQPRLKHVPEVELSRNDSVGAIIFDHFVGVHALSDPTALQFGKASSLLRISRNQLRFSWPCTASFRVGLPCAWLHTAARENNRQRSVLSWQISSCPSLR